MLLVRQRLLFRQHTKPHCCTAACTLQHNTARYELLYCCLLLPSQNLLYIPPHSALRRTIPHTLTATTALDPKARLKVTVLQAPDLQCHVIVF
jgi:hypothetical protein